MSERILFLYSIYEQHGECNCTVDKPNIPKQLCKNAYNNIISTSSSNNVADFASESDQGQ